MTNFELLSVYVLNCFKYIFWDKCPKKNQTRKKMNYVKMTWYSQRF